MHCPETNARLNEEAAVKAFRTKYRETYRTDDPDPLFRALDQLESKVSDLTPTGYRQLERCDHCGGGLLPGQGVELNGRTLHLGCMAH